VDTIENYKQEYLKVGGDPELLKDFKDLKTSKSLSEMQKRIFELKQGSNAKVKDPDTVKQSFKKLEELRGKDISGLDDNSDEYRIIQNQIIEKENKIRLQLGLQPKPFMVLDSTLNNLIQLGPEACTEYVKTIPIARRSDIEDRISQLSASRRMEEEREQEYLNFVMETSEKLNFLSGVTPQQYNIDKAGQMTANPVYQKWVKDIFQIQTALNKKVLLAQSLENNMEIKQDHRGSIYKLSEKVDALIKKHDLKE
jgi:hypothetical protein